MMKKVLFSLFMILALMLTACSAEEVPEAPATAPVEEAAPAEEEAAPAEEEVSIEYENSQAAYPTEFAKTYQALALYRGETVAEALLATAFAHADAAMQIETLEGSLPVWDDMSVTAKATIRGNCGDNPQTLVLEDLANDEATLAFMASFKADHPDSSILVIFRDSDPDGLTIWTVAPLPGSYEQIKYVLICPSAE